VGFRRLAFARSFVSSLVLLGFGVGQNPVRQTAGETARSTLYRRLTLTWARRRFFEIGLALLGFLNGSNGLSGTSTMLGKIFAGQNEIVFTRFALCRAAITLAGRSGAAIFVTAARWAAAIPALRRSVF